MNVFSHVFVFTSIGLMLKYYGWDGYCIANGMYAHNIIPTCTMNMSGYFYSILFFYWDRSVRCDDEHNK